MSPERKLLSLLVDPAEIATVWDLGLRAEVFEEPFSQYVYSFIINYWLDSKKTAAPTAYVIEAERPGFKVQTDVEEEAWWLAKQLMKRFATNGVQQMCIAAAKTCHEDPVGTLDTLLESAAEAKEHIGKAGREEGLRVWDALDLNPAEQPRWLASRRLPRAAVTLLLGDEGIGKSLFWVLLVAHITTGKPFVEFGIPAREPELVVLVITEDDWSKDVRPRLELVGADLSMIKVICEEKDGSGSPVFPRDIGKIDAIDPRPALVVVDCWLDTVSPGKRVSDAQQAREALHPWKDLATRIDAGVLLLGHTNRVATANPREKYGATYALRQKARMTLFAQLDQDGQLQIGPEKANRTAILPASTFVVQSRKVFPVIVGEDGTVEDDGTVALLAYQGESTKTAGEHLADNYAADHDTKGQHDAVAWLAALLGPAPLWSTDVHSAREKMAETVSKHKFNSAKKRLNVASAHSEASGAWFMRLPQHGDRTPETPPAPGDTQNQTQNPVCPPTPRTVDSSDSWSENQILGITLQRAQIASTSQDSQNPQSEVAESESDSGKSSPHTWIRGRCIRCPDHRTNILVAEDTHLCLACTLKSGKSGKQTRQRRRSRSR
jgi:hypothetical protein